MRGAPVDSLLPVLRGPPGRPCRFADVLKSVVDDQLPAVLARRFASRGLDRRHVLDLDLAQASDLEIWRHAAMLGMIVVGKDEVSSISPQDPARLRDWSGFALVTALSRPRSAEYVQRDVQP